MSHNSTESSVAARASELLAERPLRGKRILLITADRSLPSPGRTWISARTLRAAGARISIIAPKNVATEPSYAEQDGIHIYRYTASPSGDAKSSLFAKHSLFLLRQTFLAWRIYWTRGFHVIHGCNPPDFVFLTALPFRAFGVRYLFDQNKVVPELYQSMFQRRDLLWRLLLLTEKLAFRTASTSLAIGMSEKHRAIDHGGMKPERVFVVRNIPSYACKPAPPPDAHKRKNERPFIVCYAGDLTPAHGADSLLPIADHIIRRHKREDIHFCLIGNGPLLENLRQDRHKMKLQEQITITAPHCDKQKLEFLAAADICIYPGTGDPLHEDEALNILANYFALDKPVVQFLRSTRRNAVRNATRTARTQTPAGMADEIVELLESPLARSNLGTKGHDLLKTELNWLSQIPSLLSAYQTMLKG